MTATQYDQRAATCWFGIRAEFDARNESSNAWDESSSTLDAPDTLTGSTHCASWEGGDAYATMIYFQR